MSYASSEANSAAHKKAIVDIFFDAETVTVGPRGIETVTRIRPNPGDRIHIITAHNSGVQLEPAEIQARQEALEAELEEMGLVLWQAKSRHRGRRHGEPSVAIRGLDRDEARELGAKYGQDAIFEWTLDCWGIIPCGPGTAEFYRDGKLTASHWVSDLGLMRRLLDAGLDDATARQFAELGVAPEMVDGPIDSAVGFIGAAGYQGLDGLYVVSLLEHAAGNPDRAWELWSLDEAGVEEPE